MTLKPFSNQSGYTIFDNTILDRIMRTCDPYEWLILCAIIRKTRGWNKTEDRVSISQFMELTGIKTRTTVIRAVNSLIDHGYILKVKKGVYSVYSLNLDYEFADSASPANVPEVVQQMDTQNTKESNRPFQKKERSVSPPTPSEEPYNHPALLAYRSITHYSIPRPFRKQVIEIVGDDELSLQTWKALVHDWWMIGFNKHNISGMLEAFLKGGISKRNNRGYSPPPGKDPFPVLEEYDYSQP